MSDLISKSDLLKELDNKNTRYETIIEIKDGDSTSDIINETLKGYRKVIKDAIMGTPTAFDVDKVVRQLEKNKINCNNSNTIFDTDDYVKLDKVIEIVRGGGNDE